MKEIDLKTFVTLMKIVAVIIFLLVLSQLIPGQDARTAAFGQSVASIIDAIARSSAVVMMSCIGGLAGFVGITLPIWLMVKSHEKQKKL